MAGIELKEGMRILFQGDSITDGGRHRTPQGPGFGYVAAVRMILKALYPEKRLEIMNRGLASDRVEDLEARWQADCIDLRPDLVSILIGINDCGPVREFDGPPTVGAFEQSYRNILARVRDELGAKIVLMEPFVLPHSPDRAARREDLDPKIDTVRRLAREFADVLVPLDGIMNAAAVVAPSEYWARDGVHPTPAGHGLIALEWIKAVTGRGL